MNKIKRQGDVLVIPVPDICTSGWEEVDSLTVALGEATGHHHTVYAERQKLSIEGVQAQIAKIKTKVINGIKYFKIDQPCVLRHQEHAEILLQPGTYKAGAVEKEFDPFENIMRQVRD